MESRPGACEPNYENSADDLYNLAARTSEIEHESLMIAAAEVDPRLPGQFAGLLNHDIYTKNQLIEILETIDPKAGSDFYHHFDNLVGTHRHADKKRFARNSTSSITKGLGALAKKASGITKRNHRHRQ